MKTDIRNKADIQSLVDTFHRRLRQDPEFDLLFEHFAQKNETEHLEAMTAFWESALFQAGVYKANTLDIHLDIHFQYRLKAAHFNHWLVVFQETLEDLFDGPNARQALEKAISMASVIKMKIDHLDGLRQALNN